MHYWDDGWNWYWMVPMMVVWIALIAVVVWGVVRIVGAASSRATPQGAEGVESRPERPQDILDRRLASGEIDIEEHRRLREALARSEDEPRH